VKFRLWIKSPLRLPLSWLTKSTLKKPGLVLSHPLKVRTGMVFFSKLPGLVVDLPLICCFFLINANSRSMVAAEIVKSFSLNFGVSFISPCLSNTGINSAKKRAVSWSRCNPLPSRFFSRQLIPPGHSIYFSFLRSFYDLVHIWAFVRLYKYNPVFYFCWVWLFFPSFWPFSIYPVILWLRPSFASWLTSP